MANQPPYNLQQSVFMLSLGSNGAFGKLGDQATLQSEMEAYLGGPSQRGRSVGGTFFEKLNAASADYPGLAGHDWETVWGPVVYVAHTDRGTNPGATNTMYVAKSASQNCFVVAIAGTNPLGIYGMTVEDLKVEPANMRAWPPTTTLPPPPAVQTVPLLDWGPANGGPAVAEGTSIGLSVLFTMQDPASGQTLQKFLADNTNSTDTLVFTGHSLGGALSPTLALLLYPKGATQSGWANIYILATAGPTPGNAALAELFTAAYPATPIAKSPTGGNPSFVMEQWNVIYANQWDLVPKAWDQLSNLIQAQPNSEGDYPSFFVQNAPLVPAVATPVGAAVNKAQAAAGYSAGAAPATPYYTAALSHTLFSGSWGKWQWPKAVVIPYPYPPTWGADKPDPAGQPVTNIADFTSYLLNAHLDQYSYALLGYPAPKNVHSLADAPGD